MTKKEMHAAADTIRGLWPHATLASQLWDELYLATLDYSLAEVQAELRRQAGTLEFPPSPPALANELKHRRTRAQAGGHFFVTPRADKATFNAHQSRCGWVPLIESKPNGLRSLVWIKRTDAVKHNHKWVRKIDYVCDLLGGPEVMKRMGSLGLSIGELIAGEFSPSLLETYRQLLDLLVETAQAKEKQDALGK